MVRKRLIQIVVSISVLLVALIVFSPIVITIYLSFAEGGRTYVEFFIWEPVYLRSLIISLFIAIVSTFGAIVLSVFAAFVFAKINFGASKILLFIYVVVMLMPFQVTMLPQYLMTKSLNLYDNVFAIILPFIFSPLAVFFLTQSFKTFPTEIIEAAYLDTSSLIVILTRVILPATRPSIICMGVLMFTESWNVVAEPLILVEEINYPLSVIINQISANDILALASTVIFFIPPCLLFSIFESEIMNGIGECKLK